MSAEIITLPPELVSKIAAGEVIERPASCIKELVENSIDAQAHSITCEVKGNGVPEMRVSDDGIGMTLSELELVIKPHTTSKLKSEEELERIKNLGFRGEALPSICRVAELEINSKPKDGEVGGYIRVKDEKVVEKRDSARAVGTTIRVRNLFYNMPARRKFLKSQATELRYITLVIHRLALAYPNISFTLIHDNHEILSLPLQTLSQRISELLGADFLNTLAYVKYESPELQIYGYVSKPYSFLSKATQFTFINRRPCRDKVIKRAIEQAYGIPLKEKAPSYIFFINILPELVDVNVHPRKEEVRFRDENFIFTTVIKAVRESLGIKAPVIRSKKREIEFDIEGANFWQFYDSYIFVETKEGILILDQHAAHERIMYDRIKQEKVRSQRLIFPILIELSEIEQKLLQEFKSSFEELGFRIEEFGGGTWRITSVPSILQDFSPELFKIMLLELTEHKDVSENRLQETIRLLACKSAIKAGARLGNEEIEALAKELFKSENPYFCPHGRPIIMKLTREELDRKFGK
jgi:DNA mismatch repair protein MutL